MLSNCLESGGPVLSEAHGRIKPCSVNATSWFPLLKSSPICPARSKRSAKPTTGAAGFTLADQVNQLVGASEADPDLGFMARLMALCSLPRSNPGNRHRYVRRNGPYTLIMYSSGEHKLPFGNLPRLLLAGCVPKPCGPKTGC